jgi:hypothetical protein
VLSRTYGSSAKASGKNELKLSHAELAARIIEINYLNADFRRILGINFFNDIPWFNKEGFEDALFCTSLFSMIEGEDINRVTGIYNVLVKAEKKSQYRFDVLLDILTAKKPAAKKTETKKASSKKVEPKAKSGSKSREKKK